MSSVISCSAVYCTVEYTSIIVLLCVFCRKVVPVVVLCIVLLRLPKAWTKDRSVWYYYLTPLGTTCESVVMTIKSHNNNLKFDQAR